MKLKLLSSRILWNYESIQFFSDSIISYDSSVRAVTGETEMTKLGNIAFQGRLRKSG